MWIVVMNCKHNSSMENIYLKFSFLFLNRNRHIFYENKLIDSLNVTEDVYQHLYEKFLHNSTASLDIKECSLESQLDNVKHLIQVFQFS